MLTDLLMKAVLKIRVIVNYIENTNIENSFL